ncbi:hypothetical protein ES707_18171 [subsurface metagenome]
MKNAYKVILIGLAVVGVVYAGTKPGAMTREEKNKAIVRRALEATHSGDWELMRNLYSPKFVQHSPASREPIGWEDYELGCRIARRKLPDFRHKIEDIIAEGDKVVVRLSASTPVKGHFLERSYPDGVMKVTEIDIVRIADGRIVEEWVECDVAQFLEFLRVMKYTGQAR